MLRSMLLKLLAAVLLFLVFIIRPTEASLSTSEQLMAAPAQNTIYVNSRPYTIDAYNIGGYTYYQLRALAQSANVSVSYDTVSDSVRIDTAQAYDTRYASSVSVQTGAQTAVPTKSNIIVDGSPVHIQSYLINGYNYIQLRDFTDCTNFLLQYGAAGNDSQPVIYNNILAPNTAVNFSSSVAADEPAAQENIPTPAKPGAFAPVFSSIHVFKDTTAPEPTYTETPAPKAALMDTSAPVPAFTDTPTPALTSADTPVPILTVSFTPIPTVTYTPTPALTPGPTAAPVPGPAAGSTHEPAAASAPLPAVTQTSAPADTSSGTNDQFVARVIELVNIERSNDGVPQLQTDPILMQAALYKCRDIINTGQFSHDSLTYGKAYALMGRFGIKYAAWGENIAAGQTSPEEVMDAWMNSPGHRDNILNELYQYIGVGFLYDSSWGTVWSQEFIEKP